VALSGGQAMTASLTRLAIALVAALSLAAAAPGAWAQSATIKIVVPYTPGSGPDILARLMAEQIGRTQGTNSFVVNPALKRANYDPTRDFEPVCYLAATPMVLVVLGSSPYRTLDDLIAAARAKPGELAFASGGPGSSLHVAIEVLKRAANINVTYVPYGGTAPAINALMGNHVAAVWADYPTVVSQLDSGTLRGLVTTSRARVETLPNVPTLGETGISNYDADIFYGVVAPAKTPPDALAQLSGWFSGALKAPDMKPKLAQQGLFPVGTCGAEFGAYLRRQGEEYSRIIREANITVK
jgi:tripartite-type tricarboxylate transporter receptor subunit TctC